MHQKAQCLTNSYKNMSRNSHLWNFCQKRQTNIIMFQEYIYEKNRFLPPKYSFDFNLFRLESNVFFFLKTVFFIWDEIFLYYCFFVPQSFIFFWFFWDENPKIILWWNFVLIFEFIENWFLISVKRWFL